MPYFNREDKEKLEEKLKKVYELPDFYNDGDDDDNDDWDDEIYNDWFKWLAFHISLIWIIVTRNI